MTLKQFKKSLASFGEVHLVKEEVLITREGKKKFTEKTFVGFLTLKHERAGEFQLSELSNDVSLVEKHGFSILSDFAKNELYLKVRFSV